MTEVTEHAVLNLGVEQNWGPVSKAGRVEWRLDGQPTHLQDNKPLSLLDLSNPHPAWGSAGWALRQRIGGDGVFMSHKWVSGRAWNEKTTQQTNRADLQLRAWGQVPLGFHSACPQWPRLRAHRAVWEAAFLSSLSVYSLTTWGFPRALGPKARARGSDPDLELLCLPLWDESANHTFSSCHNCWENEMNWGDGVLLIVKCIWTIMLPLSWWKMVIP